MFVNIILRVKYDEKFVKVTERFRECPIKSIDGLESIKGHVVAISYETDDNCFNNSQNKDK